MDAIGMKFTWCLWSSISITYVTFSVHILKKFKILLPNLTTSDWCWSWDSNTLATWCKELTHWKRPWCWERLRAGREGDDRGWDGWMISLPRWTWVWVDSSSWWWTGRSGVLRFMGSQKVGHDWATELNFEGWTFPWRFLQDWGPFHFTSPLHLPLCSAFWL